MSEYDDIQSQLKAWAGFVSSGYEVPAAGGTMNAAADAIEALVKERDLWKSDADRQRQLREADGAEVERLKGGLARIEKATVGDPEYGRSMLTFAGFLQGVARSTLEAKP